jgi:MerR family transcriptional regulator/heat shock protein HspR
MHPQTLRLYEKLGLIKPSRSTGKCRLYSDEDIEKLKQIQILTQKLGVNLAGVEIILNMMDQMKKLKEEMEKEIEELKKEFEEEFKKIRRHTFEIKNQEIQNKKGEEND